MAAMAYVESRFDPQAESGNGAEGLMQILPSVFRQYGIDANGDGKRDIFTAADSVATSAVYTCMLAALVRSIPGDQVALRLAAYNAGIGAVTQVSRGAALRRDAGLHRAGEALDGALHAAVRARRLRRSCRQQCPGKSRSDYHRVGDSRQNLAPSRVSGWPDSSR